MADVRTLLRKERTERRINHPQATYSTKGTLICLICNAQLKSDSLWAGHLRSTQHAMRAQRMKDTQTPSLDSAQPAVTNSETVPAIPSNRISRKRSRDKSPEDARKKSKPGVPEGFLVSGFEQSSIESTSDAPSGQEIQLVSRPATPLKTTPTLEAVPQLPSVDEDEWAAFEAEIAAAEDAPRAEDAVISAPAISAEELATKARQEESAHRKERHEAELEGDKEDAARKLEDEFEEIEKLESRLQKLKEKREALRLKEQNAMLVPVEAMNDVDGLDDSDEDEDDEDDTEWDAFPRMR